MPELTKPQSKQDGSRPNRRVIVLGAILVGVFLIWIVTMIVSSGRL